MMNEDTERIHAAGPVNEANAVLQSSKKLRQAVPGLSMSLALSKITLSLKGPPILLIIHHWQGGNGNRTTPPGFQKLGELQF